jgi:redox-sensitive bicupin YhaK (pirin superfamily)
VKYQPISNNDMVKVLLDDSKSAIEIIAGEYNGLKGPAFTFSPMDLFNAKLLKGDKATFSFSKDFNTGMLVIEGKITVNNKKPAPENHFILFDHDGEDITIEAEEDSIVLILNGEPINEPIASYGPFVMNTEAEIKQAFEEYKNGKFGYLED